MDAVSLRGYWEMCFKLQCWFLRLTARKFSLLLTNASQSINGWTRKTCFSPIKQPNMCLGWFVVSSTCFPSFGSTAPKHFGRQCKGREGRKDVCFLMTLAWKWHTVTSLAPHQQELLSASPEPRPAWKRSPWLDSHLRQHLGTSEGGGWLLAGGFFVSSKHLLGHLQK